MAVAGSTTTTTGISLLVPCRIPCLDRGAGGYTTMIFSQLLLHFSAGPWACAFGTNPSKEIFAVS